MKKNIGTVDRWVRFIIGLAFLAFAWYYASWILLFVAIFCFYEAAAGWCAMYQILGKNSCPIERNKK